MASRLRIEPLSRTRAVEDFDCGREPLNRFLIRHALQSQQADASRTSVAVEGDRVVGYFTLVFGEVARVAAPPRIGRPTDPLHLFLLMKDLRRIVGTRS